MVRKGKWSERQDSNLRRLAPKASALARLSYAPIEGWLLSTREAGSATAILNYSHSLVAGGLLEISRQTRLTPLTSLIIREESFSRRSYGSFTQSAVIPS